MTVKKEQPIDSAELRRRAEERLGEKTAPPLETDKDQLRLHHELQVHQIELEMQNTELRENRDEMETALKQYIDFFELAPVGYFTLDRKGTIRNVNLMGVRLVGVERSQLVGQLFEQLITDETRSAFTAFLKKLFTRPAPESCEVALLKEGNAALYMQVEGVAAPSDQECRIALIDITERKWAEVALKKVEEATEVALKEVAEDAEVALLKVEETVYKALQNAELQEALPRMIAVATKEARKMVEEATIEARRKVIEEAKIAEALRRERGVTDFTKGEQSAEIARQKVEDATEAARNKMGARTAVHQTWADASDKLRLEKVLAESVSQAKSQFLANMSHELRTPMTGILGMLQFALEKDLSPELRGYLETTQSSALSLLRIINEILDLAKSEAGKLIIEDKPFSPRECIAEAVDIITPEVRRKGLDFVLSVTEEIPNLVVGDQMRLRQVLLNLIGNAVKFTEKGKVEVLVSAGRESSDGKREFTFTITDTGIGIPDDKKDLLFRAFSQVDPSLSRVYGGTGLGLAISKDIVEIMGGTISFVSEEGKGTAFSFTIPLGEARLEHDALTTAKSLSPETTTADSKGERTPHILLAEDDPIIRQVLGLMLKKSNYNLDIAEDGFKALEMWEKGEYDLVLMDVQMPRLNGFEVTSVIRDKERERGGHTPIIAMTAHARREDEELCLAAGMDAYISKPIDFKQCLQVIGDIIRQTATP